MPFSAQRFIASIPTPSADDLPQASSGIIAASIFVFLEPLDKFTGTFSVGVPDITTLPLLLYNASMSGNYQVLSITALILSG